MCLGKLAGSSAGGQRRSCYLARRPAHDRLAAEAGASRLRQGWEGLGAETRPGEGLGSTCTPLSSGRLGNRHYNQPSAPEPPEGFQGQSGDTGEPGLSVRGGNTKTGSSDPSWRMSEQETSQRSSRKDSKQGDTEPPLFRM